MSLDQMAAKAFGVSSFTNVGHLIHINLKDHLLQYKSQIGQALLDKNPRALAVVNKVNSIDNEYRNFEIEIIAKREGCNQTDNELMLVEVNENKCRFQFNFAKVYWNSRLSTEHERIIAKLYKGHDIIFDLFAGVGPFAVPAAKAKCITYANDLNPDSVLWLRTNMKRNKVQEKFYDTYQMDAKDFILNEMKPKLFAHYSEIEEEQLATMPKIHIIMNLPALAPTFLPHFCGLFRNDLNTKLNCSKKLSDLFKAQKIEHIIYCYCFLKGAYEDPKAEVRNLVEIELGKELDDDQLIDIFRVRNVAPFKEMYRVEIRLDDKLLFYPRQPTTIMKKLTANKTPSGQTPKRVTIMESNGKRPFDSSVDLTDSSVDDGDGFGKRTRTTENSTCSIV